MLVIDERAAGGLDAQGAYFDGSLELLRELAVTSDLDAALPRLSAIVDKMLPHDALRMGIDQGGQPVVHASTADVPDMAPSDVDELIIDDLRSGVAGASADPQAMARRSAPATARSWGCRPATPILGSASRSGRSGRWRSIARMCRSHDGSPTTSVSGPAAARSARSPIGWPTPVRRRSTSPTARRRPFEGGRPAAGRR